MLPGTKYSGGLARGDHSCLLYKDVWEQREAAVHFFKAGLVNNEKCFYIADETSWKNVAVWFMSENVDLDKYLGNRQLNFLMKEEIYLRGGSFDIGRMLHFLNEAEKAAAREMFSGIRITSEMTWFFSGKPGVEKLIDYESSLNRFFPGSKAVAVCQYNEKKFPPEILVDVLHTHPIAVVAGKLCRNHYYVPPDEFEPGELKGDAEEVYNTMKKDIVIGEILDEGNR